MRSPTWVQAHHLKPVGPLKSRPTPSDPLPKPHCPITTGPKKSNTIAKTQLKPSNSSPSPTPPRSTSPNLIILTPIFSPTFFFFRQTFYMDILTLCLLLSCISLWNQRIQVQFYFYLFYEKKVQLYLVVEIDVQTQNEILKFS